MQILAQCSSDGAEKYFTLFEGIRIQRDFKKFCSIAD